MPLTTAVESWIELAHQKNGHDDVAVAIMSCQVTSSLAAVTAPEPLVPQQDESQPTEMTEASRALLYGEVDEPSEPPAVPIRAQPALQTAAIALAGLVAVGIMGVAAVLLWQNLSPSVPPELEPSPTAPAP